MVQAQTKESWEPQEPEGGGKLLLRGHWSTGGHNFTKFVKFDI